MASTIFLLTPSYSGIASRAWFSHLASCQCLIPNRHTICTQFHTRLPIARWILTSPVPNLGKMSFQPKVRFLFKTKDGTRHSAFFFNISESDLIKGVYSIVSAAGVIMYRDWSTVSVLATL